MAEHVLIDRYLREFRSSLSDVDQPELLVDEVADHLLERVEQYVVAGVEALRAQRRALAEFGDPVLMGREFASANTGGAAVPTNFTRNAGKVGYYTSLAFPLAVVLFFISNWLSSQRGSGAGDAVFVVLLILFPIAFVGSAVLAAGLTRRHGSPRQGWAATALLGAAAVGAVAPWFWSAWAWSAPLLIGLVLLAAVHRSGWMAVAAIGGVGMGGLTMASGLGWLPDTPGLGMQIVMTGCFVLIGLGLNRVAAELAAEEPLDEMDRALTA